MGTREKAGSWRPGLDPAAAAAEILREAGCSAAQIQAFVQCLASGDRAGQCAVLEQRRARLLAQLHRAEHGIDCLDFLDYQLRRTREREKALAAGHQQDERQESSMG